MNRNPFTTTQIRTLMAAVEARLNGEPDSDAEWNAIALQLEQAGRLARKVAKRSGIYTGKK